MKIQLPGCYPLHLGASLAHWEPDGMHHGAKSNPAVIHLSLVKLGTNAAARGTPGPDSSGLRLWVYFRGGYAWFCEVHIGRGDLPTCPTCGRPNRA